MSKKIKTITIAMLVVFSLSVFTLNISDSLASSTTTLSISQGIGENIININSISERALHAILKTTPIDPFIHKYSREIKAVTYHQIKVIEKDNIWEAIGAAFVSICLVTTIIATILGIASRHRTWCVMICPMGKLQKKINSINAIFKSDFLIFNLMFEKSNLLKFLTK